jgi:hypothetical protein
MDRIKKLWSENEDWITAVTVFSSIAVATVAVLQTKKANGFHVTSCDLMTGADGEQVIATYYKNGMIETWRKPIK